MTLGPFTERAVANGPRGRSRAWLEGSAAVGITLGLVALTVAAIAVGLGSVCIWAQSGAFWPEAIPPRVQYLSGDYVCKDLGAPDMRGLTLQGHTIGGGSIYARPPIGSEPSAGFVVVTDGHRRETCISG